MHKQKKHQQLKIGLVLDSSLDLEDGVQQYVMSVGEWLRLEGHDVHYLVGQTNSRNLPNIHSLSRNVVATFNGNKINLPLWAKSREVKKLLAQEDFDVLHVQSPHHPFMAQRIIRAASPRTAVVATFHILPYSKLAGIANKALGWLLRPSLKRVDQMLAVTPAAARFEQDTFGIDTKVLPNVFDYEVFNQAKPFPAYAQSKAKHIIFLGRLVERKGCQTLLAAVDLLKQRGNLPDFDVTICGKGELEQKLKAFVKDKQLQDIVTFTGFVSVEDKPKYYASADISVFPSSGGESFGIVLLEAMASGNAAVLAGNNPGYSSVMEPQPELIFPATDATEFADVIADLLLHDDKRQQFARWGEQYSKQFGISEVGPELVELYRELLAERNMR